MTNPLDQFRSGLFGSRGVDVAAALEYVDQLATASSDPVAVQTAARVLLNTVIGAVDQILNAPSPERLALIDLIDERIKATSWDRFVLEDAINDKISQWMDDNLDVEDKINDWMSNSSDLTDYHLDDAIDGWIDNNLSDKISDMDLVVRVR
jgi:hypothetical protein